MYVFFQSLMCFKMRKRVSDTLINEPLRKKSANLPTVPCECLKHGEILTDLTGKKWKLGKAIGVGGFGQIYLASDNLNEDVKSNSPYVAKVESHASGPLFVEINCYLRIARSDMSKYDKTDFFYGRLFTLLDEYK